MYQDIKKQCVAYLSWHTNTGSAVLHTAVPELQRLGNEHLANNNGFHMHVVRAIKSTGAKSLPPRKNGRDLSALAYSSLQVWQLSQTRQTLCCWYI